MNHRTAYRWETALLFLGGAVALVGAWGIESMIVALIGLGLVLIAVVIWWLYFRCPKCHTQLGRGNPKRCPNCGAWLGEESEPEPEKKKIQHKKKRR